MPAANIRIARSGPRVFVEINVGLADERIRSRLDDLGSTALGGSATEFAKIARETERWTSVIRPRGSSSIETVAVVPGCKRLKPRDSHMQISDITFLGFLALGGIRCLSYLPQIVRIIRDENGASAISYTTWATWILANLATALYALINLGDAYLALVSFVYAFFCTVVTLLTAFKRIQHRRSMLLLDRQEIDPRPQSWAIGPKSRAAPSPRALEEARV